MKRAIAAKKVKISALRRENKHWIISWFLISNFVSSVNFVVTRTLELLDSYIEVAEVVNNENDLNEK